MRPFGYDSAGNIVPAEAALLREAADRLLDGDSLRAIENSWNERGLRTSAGGRWAGNLRRMLVNPRVAGLTKSGDELTPAPWEPIVERATWDSLQEIFARNRAEKAVDTAAQPYLLTGGLVRCTLCGSPLKAHPIAGKRNYRCGGCMKIRVHGDELDTEVADHIVAKLSTPAGLAQFRRLADAVREGAENADATIAEGRRKEKDLGVQYAQGRVARGTVEAATQELEKKAREARRQTALAKHLPSDAVLDTDSAADWWAAASMAEQRAVAAVLIDDVQVGPARRRGFFDPARVLIRWQ